MKAVTEEPHKPQTTRLEDVPDVSGGSVLLEAIAVGVCGTTPRSWRVTTGGPLRERRASYSGTNRIVVGDLQSRNCDGRQTHRWAVKTNSKL
jgi:hypothetical protein